MTSLNATDFDGHVSTKHGVTAPDGRAYWVFLGKVSILSAKDALGFDVNTADSNWIARIESPDGERSMNIPGCQVQSVGQGSFLGDGTPSSHTLVL